MRLRFAMRRTERAAISATLSFFSGISGISELLTYNKKEFIRNGLKHLAIWNKYLIADL
jgi:hypothetical protein